MVRMMRVTAPSRTQLMWNARALAAPVAGGTAVEQQATVVATVHEHVDAVDARPVGRGRVFTRALFAGAKRLWRSLARAHLDGQCDQIEEAAYSPKVAEIAYATLGGDAAAGAEG
jgi:hypothetical protein